MTPLVPSFPTFERRMDSSTMSVPWSVLLLKMDSFVTGFAPSLELPLGIHQTCLPPAAVVGVGIVVWWRSRRDRGQVRRYIEVTVEMVRCRCQCQYRVCLLTRLHSLLHTRCSVSLDI